MEKDRRGCEGTECSGVKGEGRGSEATCGAQRARDRVELRRDWLYIGVGIKLNVRKALVKTLFFEISRTRTGVARK